MRIIPAILMALIFSLPAQGAMTLVSIAGGSAVNLAESTNSAPTVYGGMVFAAGTPTCTGDGNSVCDSCVFPPSGTIGSGLISCNQSAIYPSLKLVINLRGSGALTLVDAFAKTDTRSIPGASFVVGGDGTLTASIPWGGLCEAAGAGANCATVGARTMDMEIGSNLVAGGTESKKIRVILKISDGTDSKSTECPVTAAPGDGYCFFQVYPGDEKIYATELVVSDDYPSTGFTGVDFTNLVFFYEEQLTGESDIATLTRISNASPMIILPNGLGGSDPENRITGLSNGVRYCLAMANQDVTGIISKITPLSTSSTPAQFCTTPTPVVGLLDDKSCFIATAAFGSDMASEVQSLREFRNEFLLNNSAGRWFVKLYYKHSPYYAKRIGQNEFAKTIVRGVLWPVVGFAKLALAVGFIPLVLSFLGVIALFRFSRRRSA